MRYRIALVRPPPAISDLHFCQGVRGVLHGKGRGDLMLMRETEIFFI